MPERDDAAFLPKEQAALERGEEFRGRFWLFNDEGTATSGVLRWSPTDGAEIWLIGPPTDWPGVWEPRSQGSEGVRIFGLIGSNGTKITIPDGLATSSSFGTGITQLRVRASSLILFQHLDGSERWKRLLLRTGNLHEWLSITGFGKAHAIFNRRFGAQEYTVSWKAPRGKRVPIREGEIRFSTRMETDPTHWKPDRIIRTTMDAAVVAREPAAIESLHARFLVPLRDLLIVLGGFPDEVTYEAVLRGGRTRAVVLRRRQFDVEFREWQPTRPLLISARDFPDLRGMIKKWFQLHDRISPALQVLASSVARREYSSARLLDVASALETCHREIYEATWKRSWLRQHPGKKLGGRPHLIHRLEHLQKIASLPQKTTGMTKRNRELFVASRNHFAHLSAPTYRYTTDDIYDALLDTIRRGEALMQAVLMHRLGFTRGQAAERFSDHYRSWPIAT